MMLMEWRTVNHTDCAVNLSTKSPGYGDASVPKWEKHLFTVLRPGWNLAANRAFFISCHSPTRPGLRGTRQDSAPDLTICHRFSDLPAEFRVEGGWRRTGKSGIFGRS